MPRTARCNTLMIDGYLLRRLGKGVLLEAIGVALAKFSITLDEDKYHQPVQYGYGLDASGPCLSILTHLRAVAPSLSFSVMGAQSLASRSGPLL